MTSTGELLQAEAELWCHAFGYLKSMALQCAIKLGIPTAIHRCGGTASLAELHAALPVASSKRPCVSRIMTFLAASGIFRQEIPVNGEVVAGVRYSLTPASRLLVDDDDDDSDSVSSHHPPSLSRFLLLCCSPHNFRASQSLADWLRDDDDGDEAAAAAAETPFVMANGASLYGLASRDPEFGAHFSQAMGSDSRFLAEILARGDGFAPVFAGLTSLVDVGGGDGTTARAIARAYPHVRCSVLELPQVVDALPADGEGDAVEFVAGDMMEYIPPADAVLFKFVLHNWSDEECVRILKLSKDAISTREPKGKELGKFLHFRVTLHARDLTRIQVREPAATAPSIRSAVLPPVTPRARPWPVLLCLLAGSCYVAGPRMLLAAAWLYSVGATVLLACWDPATTSWEGATGSNCTALRHDDGRTSGAGDQ